MKFLLLLELSALLAIAMYVLTWTLKLVSKQWTRAMHRGPTKIVTTPVRSVDSQSNWFHSWWSLKVLKEPSLC